MAVTDTSYWVAQCHRCRGEYDDGAGIAVYPQLSDMNTYAAAALSYDGWAVIGGKLLCEADAPEPADIEGHPIDVDQAREALTEQAARIAACDGCGHHAYAYNEAASCAWPVYLPIGATSTQTTGYHHELAEFCGWWVRGAEIRCPQCRPTDAANVYCGHPVKRLCRVCLVCRACAADTCDCPVAAAEVDEAQAPLF